MRKQTIKKDLGGLSEYNIHKRHTCFLFYFFFSYKSIREITEIAAMTNFLKKKKTNLSKNCLLKFLEKYLYRKFCKKIKNTDLFIYSCFIHQQINRFGHKNR